jgi:hypothetical protein
MKYFFIFMSALFFIGCSPKYRSVSQYTMPKSEAGKACLVECQKKQASCKEICKANFEICKVKAEKAAHESYEKKMHEYTIRLEQYASDVEMFELERSLYYDGFYGYGYGYYGRGFYNPRYMFWASPMPLFVPKKPVKPSLAAEIQAAEMKMCRIDCGCTKSYDDCFVGCGGEVKTKQVCIKNCPSER